MRATATFTKCRQAHLAERKAWLGPARQLLKIVWVNGENAASVQAESVLTVRRWRGGKRG
jgi:hypothetical protein